MASIIRIYSMRCLKDGMNKDRLGWLNCQLSSAH